MSSITLPRVGVTPANFLENILVAKNYQTWEEAVTWLVSQPDKQDIVRIGYYDSPLSEAAKRFWQSAEWRGIKAYLPNKKGLALEVGAGRGIGSYGLAKEGWKVVALEPDPSELVGVGAINSLAAAEGLPIETVQEFGENLPFQDSHFDVVLTRQVLHHARDLPRLCREIARVLKPGGTLIAARDHVLFRKADLPKFLAAHPLHQLYGGENAYLLREYLSALRAAPLTVTHILRSFDTPIHYDDAALQDICARLSGKFAALPFGKRAAATLFRPGLLRRLGRFDIRPGSAVSFVCRKPGPG